MSLPVKTMLMILSIATCLGAGMWLVAQPVAQNQRETLIGTAPPVDDSVTVAALQQQLAVLHGRVERLENTQRQMLVLSQRLAQLEQSHPDLIQELRALVRQQATPGQSDRRQEVAERVPDAALTDSQTSTADDERRKDDIEHFEGVFWQEPEDPTWSRDIETSMAAALEELQIPDTVLDWVQCQQSACRIEFLHPEGTGDATFIETVHATEAFSSEFYAESIVESDGQRRTLVYLARPGQSLFSLHNP